MIGPFGRQGPAATFRQHCPQMTQRRCIPVVAYHFSLKLPAAFTHPGASTLADLCKDLFKNAVRGEGRQMLFFYWLWLFANGAGAVAEKVMAGRSLTRRAAEGNGEGEVSKLCSEDIARKSVGREDGMASGFVRACLARAVRVCVRGEPNHDNYNSTYAVYKTKL